jgi:hypothetical protein
MTFEHMGKTIELRGEKERSGTGKLAPKIGVATRDFVAWSNGDPVDRMVMVRWKIGEGWSPLLGDTINAAKQALRLAAAHHLNNLQAHESVLR